MQILVAFIRRGLVSGDSMGKRLGMLDEALCEQGREELARRKKEGVYPEVELAYCSPLHRCWETASLIYPKVLSVITKEFQDLDLGQFAGKSYDEVVKHADYPTWSAADVETCPGGENLRGFNARCARGFRNVVEELSSKGIESAAVITHDAVIGAVMQRFCLPRSAYRDWSVAPGGGYFISYDTLSSVATLRSPI